MRQSCEKWTVKVKVKVSQNEMGIKKGAGTDRLPQELLPIGYENVHKNYTDRKILSHVNVLK